MRSTWEKLTMREDAVEPKLDTPRRTVAGMGVPPASAAGATCDCRQAAAENQARP